ncbi:MAG TPA: hypothetical protein VIO61_05290 [Anaerolineaceae bacterium]
MPLGSITLLEVTLQPEGIAGIFACPPEMRPGAGQYLLASAPGFPEPFPTALFTFAYQDGRLTTAPPLPATWTAGMTIAARGPLGTGFDLPSVARHVSLAGLGGSTARLQLLAAQALAQEASVVLFAATPPPELPDEVEVLPLEELPGALAWADYLALDVPLSHLGSLPDRLRLKPGESPSCRIEVLVYTTMPCGGAADCGVCAVPARSGSAPVWKYACKDGPVFGWEEIAWQ